MSQHPDPQLTLEERYLIEEHQLGVPLSIYRLKASLISSLRFHTRFMLIVTVSILLMTLFYWHSILTLSAQSLSELQQEHLSDAYISLFRSLAMSGCLFFLWLFLVLVRLPSVKKRRLIVCENGFLHIKGKMRGHSVDVVRWDEIESLVLEPSFIQVSISHEGKEKKPLAFEEEYEHFDELLAQIKQYSHFQEKKEPGKVGHLIYFQGSFLVDKPLHSEHQRYLQRFSQNQRVTWYEEQVEHIPDPLRVAVQLPVGPDGAYFVGKAAVGEDFELLTNGKDLWLQTYDQLIQAYDKPPHGQPGLWCDWVPSEDGQYILHNGSEKSLYAEEWLYYLIEHFLRPWGYALSGQVQWHVLEVGFKQQGTITIEDNVIEGFDVSRFERHIAAMQRGYMDMPSQQILDEQGQIESEQNVVDYHTKEHPF